MAIYQLGILGSPPVGTLGALTNTLSSIVSNFGLSIPGDVSVDQSSSFLPDPKLASAALYFGGVGVSDPIASDVIAAGVPIVPVVSDLKSFSAEIPLLLRHINGLSLSEDDAQFTKIASVLLECVGLLPRQRRVFLSYRRTESRAAAM